MREAIDINGTNTHIKYYNSFMPRLFDQTHTDNVYLCVCVPYQQQK